MRGDVVFRVYGVHEGRAKDNFFGAFRTRAEAEGRVAELEAKVMRGTGWARTYHNKGFAIREHVVETAFEVPPRPKPPGATTLRGRFSTCRGRSRCPSIPSRSSTTAIRSSDE